MTNDSKVNEDPFTLVTSQRRNKKKHKRTTPIFRSSEEEIDEELVIR